MCEVFTKSKNNQLIKQIIWGVFSGVDFLCLFFVLFVFLYPIDCG